MATLVCKEIKDFKPEKSLVGKQMLEIVTIGMYNDPCMVYREYIQNAADAIALGVDPRDIYVQSRKEQGYYEFTFELSKKITRNMFEAIYGHVDLGKVSAVFLQIADILHVQLPFMFGTAPTITGIGIDQDPHARITRDVAKRVDHKLEAPSFFYFEH